VQAILNVALPIFGVILAGYLAGRWRILGGESTAALNAFVSYFALPVLFFGTLARTPVAAVLDPALMLLGGRHRGRRRRAVIRGLGVGWGGKGDGRHGGQAGDQQTHFRLLPGRWRRGRVRPRYGGKMLWDLCHLCQFLNELQEVKSKAS